MDYPNEQAPGAPVRSGIPEHGRIPKYYVVKARIAGLLEELGKDGVIPTERDKHNVVSYDGGSPVSVRTYTADVPSRTETVTLQVPAGATGARVRFRYTGGNNWFRVVDGVGFGRS